MSTDGGSGAEKGVSWVMVDLLGDHGANDGDFVSHFGGVRQEVTDVLPAFSVAFELGQVALNFELLALKLSDGLAFGEGFRHRLPIEFIQLGLVIEGFQVRGATGHAEEYDTFGFANQLGSA